jgi:hypothetical protein
MSKEELAETAEAILKRAREKVFSHGRPIVYSKAEKIYREWQDGRFEIIQ